MNKRNKTVDSQTQTAVQQNEVREKRQYKDTVFRFLFSDRKRALSLYNAINGTDYQDESLLEFNTLENAIYMNLSNSSALRRFKVKNVLKACFHKNFLL